MLRPWLDPLARVSSAVVYPDLRGNGRSSEPHDWSVVTHETFVGDIEALRTYFVAAGLPAERIVLFGHSYGGSIALEYALAHAERLAGLILCAATPVSPPAEPIMQTAQQRATAEQFENVAGLLAPVSDDATLAARMKIIAPLYFNVPTPALCNAVYGGVRYRAAAFNHVFLNLGSRFDVRARLAELDRASIPTLLIGGADDWILPSPVALDLLAAGLPHATRVEFSHSGHYPFAEEPDAWTSIVTDWLSRHVAPRGALAAG